MPSSLSSPNSVTVSPTSSVSSSREDKKEVFAREPNERERLLDQRKRELKEKARKYAHSKQSSIFFFFFFFFLLMSFIRRSSYTQQSPAEDEW
jgi:hypothetical protein